MNRYLIHTISTVALWSLLVASVVAAENLETPHFLMIYPPADTSLAKTITEAMETARETLPAKLGVSHENQLKIKLVPRLSGGVGVALYMPERRTMEVLTAEAMTSRFGGTRPTLRFIKGVLWHEYVHFLQHQVMKRFINDRSALWFIEGTAEFLGTVSAMGPYSPEAVWREGETILSGQRLPTLTDLNGYHKARQYSLPTYFFCSDAVAFLVKTWGMESLRQITRAMGEDQDLPECLSESLGIGLEAFEQRWHEDLRKRYKSYIRNS